MAAITPLLKLVKVSKSFAAPRDGATLPVLREINLEVRQGDSVAVVGPSGSGKSTLLHIVGALDRPSSGQVLLEGQDLQNLSEKELAAVRNRSIGFVFQAHYLLPQCSVLENVLVPTLAAASRRAADDGRQSRETPAARAERLLKRVGLWTRASHRPGELSGGERQRAAVVRALINQPRLLLADEPTGALDHAAATALGQLLTELNLEESVTLIVVTHSAELAAKMKGTERLLDGRLTTVARS